MRNKSLDFFFASLKERKLKFVQLAEFISEITVAAVGEYFNGSLFSRFYPDINISLSLFYSDLLNPEKTKFKFFSSEPPTTN